MQEEIAQDIGRYYCNCTTSWSSFLEGSEYQRTMQGYDQTEWNLKSNREALACRESDLRYEIRAKEEELERLQRKLRQMEQEE